MSRGGEVWMVVLGMAASSALLGNQHAPGTSCRCDSRPLGSVRGCVGIHKSTAENAISCDDFHFSPMGKVIPLLGFGNPAQQKRFPALDFANPPRENTFPSLNLTIPARERRFPSLDFTNPA